jgi:hypothetical protein
LPINFLPIGAIIIPSAHVGKSALYFAAGVTAIGRENTKVVYFEELTKTIINGLRLRRVYRRVAADTGTAALAEVTREVLAEVTMAIEDISMAMVIEDIISVTAITATALVARVTHHTDGRTPAHTEL